MRSKPPLSNIFFRNLQKKSVQFSLFLFWFFVSFRIIALPIIAFIVFFKHMPLSRHVRITLIAATAFVSFGPIDCDLFGIQALYSSDSKQHTGLRLVKFIRGKINFDEMNDIYGEYFYGGHYGYTMFTPVWLITYR